MDSWFFDDVMKMCLIYLDCRDLRRLIAMVVFLQSQESYEGKANECKARMRNVLRTRRMLSCVSHVCKSVTVTQFSGAT